MIFRLGNADKIPPELKHSTIRSFFYSFAKSLMIGYEIEYFSFLIIAVLFSAGNAKKNVFTVFIDPIVTIDGFRVMAMGDC